MIQAKKTIIWIKDVEKKYTVAKEEIIALKNINIKIHTGEFVTLIGASGAGKSTLIRLLIREEIPSSGRIIVADRDITILKPKHLHFYRRKIGVVFQDFKLLPYLNVRENIAFALEVSEATQQEINNRIPKILDLVGLRDRAKAYPYQLSGGEKQRVTIARALIHSPKLLIADEPTGNLDPENANDVIELFKKINSTGTTVIVATHNESLIQNHSKRIISLKNGEIEYDKNRDDK